MPGLLYVRLLYWLRCGRQRFRLQIGTISVSGASAAHGANKQDKSASLIKIPTNNWLANL